LLASATCKANIARARQLIAVPLPLIDSPAAHAEARLAATEHRPPCPCCGGRMIIVESFERTGTPRAPPPSDGGVRSATPCPSPPSRRSTIYPPGKLASGAASSSSLCLQTPIAHRRACRNHLVDCSRGEKTRDRDRRSAAE